jgi:hypothetical protein
VEPPVERPAPPLDPDDELAPPLELPPEAVAPPVAALPPEPLSVEGESLPQLVELVNKARYADHARNEPAPRSPRRRYRIDTFGDRT